MVSKERGIILQEISIRNPDPDLVGTILKAQSKHPNRSVTAEWFDREGVARVTATINPNQFRTFPEIANLSMAFTGAHRLSVREVLWF